MNNAYTALCNYLGPEEAMNITEAIVNSEYTGSTIHMCHHDLLSSICSLAAIHVRARGLMCIVGAGPEQTDGSHD